MELVKEKWQKKDINEFQEYLKGFGNFDEKKQKWSKNLLNTELPVLVLNTPTIKKVVAEIAKGNYLSFLDLMIWEYYENTAINGMLIMKIKDFDTMKHYLDIYSKKADNWATCDLLSFSIKGNEEKYFALSQEYTQSDLPFVRRIGMSILFNYVSFEDYIDKIFEMLNKFKDEEHYYVNMMNAWLFCECFIKQRDKTLQYLKHHNLNNFTLNKGIQKCRDSYRVTPEDKELLLNYKVKKQTKND